MGSLFFSRGCNSPDVRGLTYYCDHPLYDSCTLYLLPSGKGLAVIQQRFNEKLKYTWWGKIDHRLNHDISMRTAELDEYLEDHAEFPKNGIYPYVEVRKLMWALRLPALKKQSWETRF